MSPPTKESETPQNTGTPTQKAYWFARSYAAGRNMVNVAYYSGIIPLYWVKNIKYESTKSKLDLLRWRMTVLFTLAVDAAILLGYLRNAERLGFNFRDGYSILALQASGSCMILNSIILHLNTLFKVNDIKVFFNTWVHFFEAFRGKSFVKNTDSKYAKYDVVCARILLIFFTQFHGASLMITLMYLARCDMSVFQPWFPTVCQEHDVRIHVIEFIPAMSLLQLLVGFQLLNSCMLYLHFLPIFTTQGLIVHKEMRSLLYDESEDCQKQQQCSYFYLNYRSLQIILTEFNQCVSFIAPAHLLYLVLVFAFILHYLLGMKFGPVETLASWIFLVVMGLYVTLLTGILSQVEYASTELLTKAKSLAPVHKFLVKVNESCKPLKIWIGTFGSAPRDLLVLWGLATLDFTITLYMM